jgi:hypothetical protein
MPLLNPQFGLCDVIFIENTPCIVSRGNLPQFKLVLLALVLNLRTPVCEGTASG